MLLLLLLVLRQPVVVAQHSTTAGDQGLREMLLVVVCYSMTAGGQQTPVLLLLLVVVVQHSRTAGKQQQLSPLPVLVLMLVLMLVLVLVQHSMTSSYQDRKIHHNSRQARRVDRQQLTRHPSKVQTLPLQTLTASRQQGPLACQRKQWLGSTSGFRSCSSWRGWMLLNHLMPVRAAASGELGSPLWVFVCVLSYRSTYRHCQGHLAMQCRHLHLL
jgi:hypothetical protein